MNARPDKAHEHKNLGSNAASYRESGVNSSPRAMQLKAVRDMANNSFQTRQLSESQTVTDHYTETEEQTIQTQENDVVSEAPTADGGEGQLVIQRSKKAAALGALIGGGIGALGFLAGPIVGGITTGLGVLLGAKLGHWLSGYKLRKMVSELNRRLGAARITPKTGGVQAFEIYLEQCAADGSINGSNAGHARALLSMTWTLNQVSGFILQCIAGKTPAEGDKILSAFIGPIQTVLGVDRQPWGAGNHEQYVGNPAYFQTALTSPVNYLNTTFPTMPDAARLRMLSSTQGWNSQKGPGQLADDLFAQDYGDQPIVVRDELVLEEKEFIGQKFMNNNDYIFVEKPAEGMTVIDTKREKWRIKETTGTHVILSPLD